jgi:predicted RNase H-like HicB family nuclease
MQHSTSTISKTYEVILDKDEDGIIFARCNELHANTEGKTEAEAKTNVKEAIELMVEDLEKDKDYSLKFIRRYSD